jgi:lysyl-tRNA synthetase class 2
MKRLLAANSGPIFQICKAFRDGESGRHHNPEFTLLEWYRPGYDHHQLMDEMDDLLREILHKGSAERISYEEVFQQFIGVSPHDATAESLMDCAKSLGLNEVENLDTTDRDDWLHLLMTHTIEPHIGSGNPTFVYDYPVSQSALARVRPGDPPVAERFEVYVEGVELANGFHELTDIGEQRSRFLSDLKKRQDLGLEPVPIDERLLAALDAGLPACAGVALGVDRLVALAAGAKGLAEVVAFPIDRA